MGKKGGRVFRNNYKGHMDKIKEEGKIRGGRWEWLGSGGVVGRKCRQLYLNNNEKNKNKQWQTKKRKSKERAK